MIKKTILLALFLSFSSPFYAVTETFFIDRPWEFVEEFFIIKLEEEQHAWPQQIKKYIPTVLASTASGYGAYYGFNALDNNKLLPEFITNFKERTTMTRGVTTGITALIAARCSYWFLNKTIEKQIINRRITKFVKKWPRYKKVTPIELHPAIEELYTSYTNGKLEKVLSKKGIDILRIIQTTVYRHFGSKYTVQLSRIENNINISGSFFHFMVGLDLTELFKTILNAWIAAEKRENAQ